MRTPISFIALFLLVALQGCSDGPPNADIQFAERGFQALARGDSITEEMIDWERFQVIGDNVGIVYVMMPNEAAKASFRKSFLAQFSASFQNSGASADSLKNWRVKGQDSARTVIAADTQDNRVLLVTVSKRDGKQKLAALSVEH